jgi:signal transduction histidine kinase
LRTPLTVLLGQIDVALRRPRTADEYRSTLEVLRSETVNLQQVVEALLFLARVEGDADLPDVATRDAGAWLRDYATHWDGNPRRADLSLDTPDGIWLTTSWPLLAQLLDNLVSNAFKYSPPRTPVRLAVRRSSDEVAFEVEDRGIGIAAEDQASVFDPFFRSQTARQTGAAGTGLGLALSARITQALKGRLTVESDGRSGSCFRVLVPTSGDRQAQ